MIEDLKRYTPEEVPDNLFTMKRMPSIGLTATVDHIAYVIYPEQKREYKLYDIANTRSPKRQGGFSLVRKDKTLEDVLEERKRELEVRKIQFGTKDNQ